MSAVRVRCSVVRPARGRGEGLGLSHCANAHLPMGVAAFHTVRTRSNRSTCHLSKRRCQGHRQQPVHSGAQSASRFRRLLAACGFFRRRRVKVFVNTAADEETTLHAAAPAAPAPWLAEHLCVTVRQRDRAPCQSGARSTVSGWRPSVAPSGGNTGSWRRHRGAV